MFVSYFRHKKSDDTHHVRVEIHPIDMFTEPETTTKPPPETPADTSPVESFLSGKNCLNGGTGWWKYEFCYGKTVEQYHIEKDGSKTSILLGKIYKILSRKFIMVYENRCTVHLDTWHVSTLPRSQLNAVAGQRSAMGLSLYRGFNWPFVSVRRRLIMINIHML